MTRIAELFVVALIAAATVTFVPAVAQDFDFQFLNVLSTDDDALYVEGGADVQGAGRGKHRVCGGWRRRRSLGSRRRRRSRRRRHGRNAASR